METGVITFVTYCTNVTQKFTINKMASITRKRTSTYIRSNVPAKLSLKDDSGKVTLATSHACALYVQVFVYKSFWMFF